MSSDALNELKVTIKESGFDGKSQEQANNLLFEYINKLESLNRKCNKKLNFYLLIERSFIGLIFGLTIVMFFSDKAFIAITTNSLIAPIYFSIAIITITYLQHKYEELKRLIDEVDVLSTQFSKLITLISEVDENLVKEEPAHLELQLRLVEAKSIYSFSKNLINEKFSSTVLPRVVLFLSGKKRDR